MDTPRVSSNVQGFLKWYHPWVKDVSDKINIFISVPNELQSIKQPNVVILDLFEKIDQRIDAKPYLQKILDKADQYGVTIYLKPIPRYKYLATNRAKRYKITRDYLIEYYKKFGFVFTTRKRYMKRLPKKTFDKGGSTLLAPNGRPSNLTPEQWRLVRTKAFKDWFGDWENSPETASKVVDENGEPLVCYHGTFSKFNVFELSSEGGYFFTKFKSIATIYAETVQYGMANKKNETPNVIQAFLNIKNPNYIDFKRELVKRISPRIKSSKNKGYEGLIIKNGLDIGGFYDQYVAFTSTQIKLADGTNTTFDGSNPDIRFENGGIANNPTVYHGTGEKTNVINALKTNSFRPFKSANVEMGIFVTPSKELAQKYADITEGNDKGVIELIFKREPKIKKFSSVKEEYEFQKLYSSNPSEANRLFKQDMLSKGYDGVQSSDDVILIFKDNMDILTLKNIINRSNPDIRFEDGGKVSELKKYIKDIEVVNDDEEGMMYSGSYGNSGGLNWVKRGNVIEVVIIESGNQKGSSGTMAIASLFLLNPDVQTITYQDHSHFEDGTSFWHRIGGDYTDLERSEFFNYFQNKFGYNPDISYAHGGLIAPNGKPSNLTPEQYALVRTPEFKAWFGDWENSPETASKVVDENGEPLVVYHGTNSDFYKFTKTKGRGKKNQSGIYLTDNPSVAKLYGDRILMCFASIKNPFTKDYQGSNYHELYGSSDLEVTAQFYRSKNKISNVDGVIFYNIKDALNRFDVAELGNNYIPFNSNQIKLADGSNTTFSPTNPDIRYSNGGILRTLRSKFPRILSSLDLPF
jgi:hypothetical protein